MSKKFNKSALAGFGVRLERLREKKKFTRAQLAESIEMHYDAILKLERGDRHPSLSTMCKIADALGMKVTGLLPAR